MPLWKLVDANLFFAEFRNNDSFDELIFVRQKCVNLLKLSHASTSAHIAMEYSKSIKKWPRIFEKNMSYLIISLHSMSQFYKGQIGPIEILKDIALAVVEL